jgi:hypothetical protein
MTDRLTPEDVTAFRRMITILRVDLTCGCRCACHAGRCGRSIDPTGDNGLDCDSGCRGVGYLDAACDLDQMARPISHMAMTPSTRTVAE